MPMKVERNTEREVCKLPMNLKYCLTKTVNINTFSFKIHLVLKA